jgi:hypothetical protein
MVKLNKASFVLRRFTLSTWEITLSISVAYNVENANATSNVKMNAEDGYMSPLLMNVLSPRSPVPTG